MLYTESLNFWGIFYFINVRIRLAGPVWKQVPPVGVADYLAAPSTCQQSGNRASLKREWSAEPNSMPVCLYALSLMCFMPYVPSCASQEILFLQRVLGLFGCLLPVRRALNTSPGRRPRCILTRYPSHLIWLRSVRRSSGSTPKLISAPCTRDLVLSFGRYTKLVRLGTNLRSRASSFRSARSSRWRTGASLQTPHWSACQSPAPFSPHSWTRLHGTPSLGALFSSCRRQSKWSQIWRCWFSSRLFHKWLWADPARAGGCGLMGPIGPHHLQKSKDPILGSPNRTPSTPEPYLEILSMKVMNWIGDKGQPWQSPTVTVNESDLADQALTPVSFNTFQN